MKEYRLETLTLADAIKRFPDLLSETVIMGSYKPTGWDGNRFPNVTLQFNGDGNYRTRELEERKD